MHKSATPQMLPMVPLPGPKKILPIYTWEKGEECGTGIRLFKVTSLRRTLVLQKLWQLLPQIQTAAVRNNYQLHYKMNINKSQPTIFIIFGWNRRP